MRSEPLIVHNVAEELTNTPQVCLRMDRVGLSLAEAFEEGLLSQKNLDLRVGWIALIVGTDGRCWASVKRITDNGRLVFEPFLSGPPGVEETARRGRPRNPQE